MVFQKVRDKLKKVPGKPESVPDRLGTVPVRRVPSGNVPVRRFSPGVNARVPVSNARSGGVPVRRIPPGSGFVRPGSRGTQSTVRLVSQGGVPGRVPVRSPAQQQSPYARSIPVRRVAPGSGFVRPGSRGTQSTVGRVPPVSQGSVSVRRVPPGSTLGGVPVNKSSGSRFSVFRDKFGGES